MSIKVEAVKIRVLNALEHSELKKTEATTLVRHYTKEQREAAFTQLINNGDIKQKPTETIKPGPNPVILMITEAGKDTLAKLKEKHA